MREQASYEKSLYQYELLRTRLEIRKYFLSNVVKEVYENIGQVLSYVRIQFALAQKDLSKEAEDKLVPGYQLIGKAIGDLRNMCKLFDPEEQLIKKNGFLDVIRLEVSAHHPQAIIQVSEIPPGQYPFSYDKMLLILGIVLELLVLLKDNEERQLQFFCIQPSVNEWQCTWQYTGQPIPRPDNTTSPNNTPLTVYERAALLGGELQWNAPADDISQLILKIPFN